MPNVRTLTSREYAEKRYTDLRNVIHVEATTPPSDAWDPVAVPHHLIVIETTESAHVWWQCQHGPTRFRAVRWTKLLPHRDALDVVLVHLGVPLCPTVDTMMSLGGLTAALRVVGDLHPVVRVVVE